MGSTFCYQWILSIIKAIEKENCDQLWDFRSPWNAYNPLFMKNQFWFRWFVNRKFEEEAIHSNTELLIHTISQCLLSSHLCWPSWWGLVFIAKSNLPVLLVWRSHSLWQAHSEAITVKHDGISMKVCPGFIEDPKRRLILSLCNCGTFSWTRQKFKGRRSSRWWGRWPSEVRHWD